MTNMTSDHSNPNTQTTAGSADLVSHVYQREVRNNQADSLSKIVEKIGAGLTVLDVGTGSGALGRYLQNQKSCLVDGVTYNEDEAAIAAPHYRRLEVIDLEHEPLNKYFPAGTYDVIVFADVLEHLRNANDVLQQAKQLLKPTGLIIISIPNVTHLGVLLNLTLGRFGRTFEGLLDATHVHFFDRYSFTKLIEEAGYTVTEQDSVVRNLLDTEFSHLSVQNWPTQVIEYLSNLPDSDIYQFVWSLVPEGACISSQTSETKRSSDVQSFANIAPQYPKQQIKVYFDRGNGYSENDAVYGNIDQRPEIQELELPIVNSEGIKSIRLDISDRPGILKFSSFIAFNEHNKEFWRWEGDWSPFLLKNQCHLTGIETTEKARFIQCSGLDPWIALPVDSNLWNQAKKLRVRISAPEPASTGQLIGFEPQQLQANILTLSDEVRKIEEQNRHFIGMSQVLADAQRHGEQLRDALIIAGQTEKELRNEVHQLQILQQTKESQIESALIEKSNLHNLINEKNEQISNYLNQMRLQQEEISWGKAKIAEIYQSHSWKATALLRWTSRILNKK